MEFRNIDYAVRARVAEITMRRAPVNAIDHGLIEDINDAYRRAKADPEVRAVILTSAFDRSFSAGMDLAMIRGKRGLDLRRYLEKLYFEMHDLQYRLGKPTIAALVGPARAAGVTLAVSCDVVIAGETASLGYWIGEPFARQGLMTAALPLVLDFAFDRLRLHRVEAACLPTNVPSRAVLMRTGFAQEGYARNYLLIDGAWQDHLLFAILREDWRG